MEKNKILIADDEARLRKLVSDYLKKDGYTPIEASDGLQALDLFYENPDVRLILLDVMMPGLDGWQVCREIRSESDVPIIMITAKSDERDELLGFELGVDEYITKPFSPRVLMARIEAMLRRLEGGDSGDILSAGGIELDRIAHRVTIDGANVDLSVKEFELLAFFLENKGQALSRESILNNVWNFDYSVEDRTVDTYVKKLRSKMGSKGDLIITVWGLGYKFDV